MSYWRIAALALAMGVPTPGCSDSSGNPDLPPGTIDALSESACENLTATPGSITSVLQKDEAVADAPIPADTPMMVTLAGPVSYVALEVPSPHTDYGIFVQPAGSVSATSTSNLPEEHGNASCPDADLGELRLHIHEFDHSILTLEGDGDVWLYFGAAGPSGHGEGGTGGDHDHGHGGAGGHGGDHS